jgi:hypothetical protein
MKTTLNFEDLVAAPSCSHLTDSPLFPRVNHLNLMVAQPQSRVGSALQDERSGAKDLANADECLTRKEPALKSSGIMKQATQALNYSLVSATWLGACGVLKGGVCLLANEFHI